VGWAEWNGRYRDAVRRYWRGDPGQVADLAYRLTGSSDLYQDDGRRPYASVNFVTAHDGFTLADLVGYNAKHNEANGEGNRDGTDDNLSWNSGAEGPVDDPRVLTLREERMRALLATLLVSQGVPMLCGGDEIGRTQQGNNNAYCQDNEISWFDWALDDRARRLLDFTRGLIRLRRAHPELRRRKFFQGRPICSADMKDLTWHRPDGGEMTEAEWRQAMLRAFAFRLCGESMDDVDERGEPLTGDTLLVLLNAEPEAVDFVLPGAHPGVAWDRVVDTAGAGVLDPPSRLDVGDRISVAGRSLQVLRAWPARSGGGGCSGVAEENEGRNPSALSGPASVIRCMSRSEPDDDLAGQADWRKGPHGRRHHGDPGAGLLFVQCPPRHDRSRGLRRAWRLAQDVRASQCSGSRPGGRSSVPGARIGPSLARAVRLGAGPGPGGPLPRRSAQSARSSRLARLAFQS
jgi:hypothetical protein